MKIKKLGLSAVAVSLILLNMPVIAGDKGNALKEGQAAVTLVNLHPDEVRGRLYAVNYQQPGLLPMCSEVKIDDIGRKRIKFTVKETGKQYSYDYHKSAVDPFPEHLKLYFGERCDMAKVKSFSKEEREAIKEGRARVGMSKDAVIFAMGYPPKHKTPSLEGNSWRYWMNRWNTKLIEFDDKGKVNKIID
jgi:hypothetical protein